MEGMKRMGAVYRPSTFKRLAWLSLLVALYAITIPFCYNTAGDPRRAAALAAQEKADKKWAGYSNITDGSGSEVSNMENVADIFGEETSLDMGDLLNAERGTSSNKTAPWLFGFMGPSKEDKRAQKEQEEMIRRFNKAAEEAGEGPMSLPPTYLPSAWACLALLATLCLHALFFLLGHWIVEFRAWSMFSHAGSKVDKTCFLLVFPPDNRGKAGLVPVRPSTYSDNLQVEFQRQTYSYTPSSNLGYEGAKKFPTGVFSLSSCPVDLPVSHYTTCKGHLTPAAVDSNTERWGKNHLTIKIPGFLEMLQSQLLSPLAIFQVFCALLWLLDEYWTFTLWSLVSVVIFEATTVFQRTRTQKMLGGMTPNPAPIYVYREKRWTLQSTKELLPGDVISVAYKRARPSAPGTGSAPTVVSGGGSDSDKAQNGKDSKEKAMEEKKETPPPKQQTTTSDATVPCDCVLLRGACVVNESSLTGESVPQMKEALAAEATSASSNEKGEEMCLDMNGAHRISILFSGTSVVTVDTSKDTLADEQATAASGTACSVPLAPDKGAIAYVLRTGFSSAQGTLFQMIEFSQQTVAGDLRETGYALLLLVAFALVAAGYVLQQGLEKKEKTTHELLLKCVIIITSVVPRQFPMQMAMAVNMALMALTKGGIFCTEPFRVPYAGKISHCLFDKTGTLTTDQLVPVGIVNSSGRASGSATAPGLEKVIDADEDVTLVLAGCHSLVSANQDDDGEGDKSAVDEKVTGDPIEVAALEGIKWSWNARTSAATPGTYQRDEAKLTALTSKEVQLEASLRTVAPGVQANQHKASLTAQLNMCKENIQRLKNSVEDARRKAGLQHYQTIEVIHRYHFSSALQRMSVIARCSENKPTAGGMHGGDYRALVKGSPEAIGSLLADGAKPEWYTQCYEGLAKRGLRVLALAYKDLKAPSNRSDPAGSFSREAVESKLLFGGFIAFECKVRADSGIVVASLTESGHKVSMLTGDSLLTSIHVAREVEIMSKKQLYLVLKAGDDAEKAYWEIEAPSTTSDDETPPLPAQAVQKSRADGSKYHSLPFSMAEVGMLSKTYPLVTIEEDFTALAKASGGEESPLWGFCGVFDVFARMSPQGKASIIKAIQQSDGENNVLMCGDGGNDVGALKQAEVGVALLAGHANSNTTDAPTVEGTTTAVVASAKDDSGAGASAEDALNAHQATLRKRADEVNKLRAAHMKAFQAKYQAEAQKKLAKKVEELTQKGELMAMWGVMKGQAAEMKTAMNKENARFMAIHGQVWDPKKHGDGEDGGGGGLMGMLGDLDSMDDPSVAAGLPQIRPGDASVAAPFTSRTPSIRSVIDLIRQGRCTLLSALMQQQIMMLESIIAAYTLSALSLHNARSSERQMMASSWLIMTAAVSFSYSSPVDKMHPERPLRSLFHPAVIISTLGQAAIHIFCMSYAVSLATDAMGEEKLAEVTEFFRKAKAKEVDASELAGCEEDDILCQFQAYWMAPFLPNLLNTTVFLVETSQMISVFFANYKGRPWMKGMLENHALFLSVFLCVGGVVVASWEMIPQLNELIQLAPFPDDVFRYKVVGLVVATIFGTLCWDRLCVLLFAPRVAKAMTSEASKTKLSDLAPIGLTLVKVIGGVFLIGTGNIMVAGIAFYWYRTYYNKKA